MKSTMEFPTPDKLELADRLTLAKWHRWLRSPRERNEEIILNRIHDRFTELGGWNDELSEQVGWTYPITEE